MGWTRQEVLDVARSTGRPVVEAWSTHNAGQMGTVLGPMLHHTGSDWSYPRLTAPTLKTVREGRSDLQNALCMYYISYDGTIYCITEKIAWHAGGGSWQGVTDGNGHYAGIEAESDGKQWTKPTVASYKRLAAAILRKTGKTVAYAPRHADYALPKGRKTDFSGMDSATFLADVNADLAGNQKPQTSEEDEPMIVNIEPGHSAVIPLPDFAAVGKKLYVRFALDDANGDAPGANVRVAVGWGENKWHALPGMDKVDGYIGWLVNGLPNEAELGGTDAVLSVKHLGTRNPLGVLLQLR